ncbi:unnamed protein product [Caenorhabditis nigoni]
MWAMANYHFTKVDDYAESYMKQVMMERYGVEFSQNAWIICVAYNPDGSPRWWNLFCTITMTFIMVVQYTVIIYCSIRMYIDMEAKIQILSPSLRALHKQFFKTLILQVVTPTITLFSPVIFIIYLPLFDTDWDIPTGIFLCAFTLYPAMDALIVLYVVQDYRKAAKCMSAYQRLFVEMFSFRLAQKDDHVGTRKVNYRNESASYTVCVV